MPSLHVLGSRQFGGADQFYVRLLNALHDAGQPVLAVNRPDSPVARALAGRDIEQVHLALANRWDFWSAWRMRRLLSERAPCVVQTYMGRATRLTRVPKGVPAVHVARLGGFYKIDGYYRHAHAWVGNTRAICDYMIGQGLPAERVFHIGNFVPEPRRFDDAGRAALRAGLAVPADAWLLFGLGRLIEKKGFQDLLAALADLPREIAGRPWVMLIGGDGEDAERLRLQCRRLGLDDRVRWLGWQDPPDPWYDLADVVVVPSRHEPLGNVILEAWNYRKPVVSSASDGARELIQPDRNGIMVPCADPLGLADGLQRALQMDDAGRRELGEAGWRELNAKHGQAAIVGAYLDLYERLMREHLGGG
ncbi:glycosyltransferase [Parasulfuritortus cantonensis]|uniref:Glycosyltransferase n=1 Tax=Parasulfuritortus cantonensis TaxID=2528202 RepID=A0A4R1BM76_9PROT|nr:glycosyltransferase [Parasulfuritortus cantonensis]